MQLIFDAFNIGRYEPEALDGCPEGYMQMSELGRPFIGGSWCGHSTGYAVYYSETSTITVSIKVSQNYFYCSLNSLYITINITIFVRYFMHH